MQYEKLKEIKDINYKVVSLGYNCLPRTVLTRWGVKPDKEKGEPTMPFDLATYETFEITKQIKEDFKSFFENIVFNKANVLFNKKQYWMKAPDCIEFVHEKNLTEKDKDKLVEVYSKRIENFRNCINSEFPILFVQLLGDCDDTKNLYETIKNIRGDKKFEFAVIDPFNITKEENTNLHILKNPYPNKMYQELWWSERLYGSKSGQLFEKKIADFCVEKIKLLK